MNVYFLVEGTTERKVYPKWLGYLAPHLKRVNAPCDATNNNYYLISGGGFPSILDNHLIDSVNDVNEAENYDYLVLAIDADDIAADEKEEEVRRFVSSNNIVLDSCKLIVMPQVVCMETWFLGNRSIYARNPSSDDVLSLTKHYNIADDDPEKMRQPEGYSRSIGDYHFYYLKTMLREKRITSSYRKSQPRGVTEPYYIEELRSRVASDQNSMGSLKIFFNFLEVKLHA